MLGDALVPNYDRNRAVDPWLYLEIECNTRLRITNGLGPERPCVRTLLQALNKTKAEINLDPICLQCCH